MLIVYDSKTGKVKKFVDKLGEPILPVSNEVIIDEPFILVTRNDGFGEVPKSTSAFLANNAHNMIGVACSGNKYYNKTYCKSADTISEMYKVPIVLKFELLGTPNDVREFIERMKEIEQTYRTQQ